MTSALRQSARSSWRSSERYRWLVGVQEGVANRPLMCYLELELLAKLAVCEYAAARGHGYLNEPNVSVPLGRLLEQLSNATSEVRASRIQEGRNPTRSRESPTRTGAPGGSAC